MNSTLPGFGGYPVNVTSPKVGDGLRFDDKVGQWVNVPGQVVYVADFPGQDLGMKFNAANASLGASFGVLQMPNGNFSVSVPFTPSSNRVILLGAGTLTSAIPIVRGIGQALFQFNLHSNISIIGTGMFSSQLVETPNANNDATGAAYSVIDTNDDGVSVFSNFQLQDFGILGSATNTVGSGTASTVRMGNAKNVLIQRVRLRNTTALGIIIGGGGSTQHSENSWILDCLLEGAGTQSVAVVNGRDFHIRGCTFRATTGNVVFDTAGGTYIDIELNTGFDYATTWTVMDNVIDNQTSVQTRNGIYVTGQSVDPNGGRDGVGIVANNSINGCEFSPETTTGPNMGVGIGLQYMKDVSVRNNNLRSCSAGITLLNCTRISIAHNDATNAPQIGLSNSTYCRINGNVSHTTAAGYYPWNETGTSDYNDYWDNNIYNNEGGAGQAFLFNLNGPHTRQWGNKVDDRIYYDGVEVDYRNSALDTELVYDGAKFAPTNKITSDNRARLFSKQAVPAAWVATTTAFELGETFTSNIDGYITGVRFYKDALNTGTHRINLWDPSLGSLFQLIASAAVTGETASGWQEQLFANPVKIVANHSYRVSYSNGISGTAVGFSQTVGFWTGGRTNYPLQVLDNGGVSSLDPGYPGVVIPTTQTTSQNCYFVEPIFKVAKVQSTNVVDFLLTTTGATDVLVLPTPISGNYALRCSYRVINAPTNVTVVATWTDDGGAQSYTMQALASKAVGSYVDIQQIFPGNVRGLPIKITVTAGTANNVIVSCNALLL